MVISYFPPVDTADPTGLLCFGGDLEVESLILAYRSGVFPWPINRKILTWFAPPQRTVLFLSELRVGRSLRKARARGEFVFAINQNPRAVVEGCASAFRPGQDGTWVTPEVQEAYLKLNSAGYMMTFEAYRDDRLVGGLYGVLIDRMFAGESMFHREPDASKLTFLFLCDYLKERGISWIDCQMLTPLFASFGAKEIPRAEFMQLLAASLDDG